jgi:membrane associated rhomboid family serine protease
MFTRQETLRQYIRLYPITTTLLILNIGVYIFTMLTGGVSTRHLYHLGAMVTTPPEQGAEVWRWFTSMFLHGSFMHLLMNMFGLYVFAPPLERILGRLRYLLLYVVTGVAASATSAYFASEAAVSIGASGAVYGVFGALATFAMLDKWRMAKSDKQIIYSITALGFATSLFIPNVNWLGHLGGLLCGALLFLVKKYMK